MNSSFTHRYVAMCVCWCAKCVAQESNMMIHDIGEVSALQEINVRQSCTLGCILILYCSTVRYDVCFTLCSSRLQIHETNFQTCQDLTKSYEFVWWILKNCLSFRYDVSLENRLLPSIVNRGCRRAGAEPMAFTWTSTFPCRSPSRCARTVVMTGTWTSFCG